jgi:hypothetical protein
MSRVEKPQKDMKIPGKRPSPKRKVRSKYFSINSLNLVKRMYIEPTASSKTFSKKVDTSPTQTGEGFKKKSHALRFYEYSLKMLFAKDLLKLLGKLSSEGQNETSSVKDPSSSILEGEKSLLSSEKTLDKEKPKTFHSSNLDKNSSRDEIQSLMKKELNSLQKQITEISESLKPQEQSLKKIFALINHELSSMSSGIKQMPKIRLQMLYTELVNIKAKINSELVKTESTKDASLLKAKEKAAEENRSLAKQQTFGAQKTFSKLITLYHSLLELKQALTEGKNLGIFSNETMLPSLQPRALIPLGIVYPFSSFKSSIALSNGKKKKFEDFEEDDENEEDLSNNKKKR